MPPAWKILIFAGILPTLLTRDTKSDVSCLQKMLTRYNENRRMTFRVSSHITFKEVIDKTLMKLPIIGKKNNQSSVCDADLEIPTLRLRDKAENLINLVSGIIHLPSGWDFSVCI